METTKKDQKNFPIALKFNACAQIVQTLKYLN